MPFVEQDGRSVWVPGMSPKGYLVAASKARYKFLHGCRKSTKSNTCQNILLQHAWLMDRAKVGIFSGNLKAGAEGTYDDLTKPEGRVSEWVEGLRSAGFKVTKEPTFETDTKMRYFRIRNRHGTESEIQVHSIDREDKVAVRFKQMRFSLIYMCEADGFKNLDTMLYLSDQLRVEHLPYEAHQFLIDCNPADEGEDHFLFQKFQLTDLGRSSDCTDPEYASFHFVMDDNPFIPEQEKQDVFKKWSYDQEKLDRFYYGLWRRSKEGAVFERQFKPEIHVIGSIQSPNPEEHTILTPDASCFELPSGWDLGDSTNHALIVGAKRVVDKLPVFDIIDEWFSNDSNTTPEDIVRIWIEKEERWAKYMKQAHSKDKLVWHQWSDSSAMRRLTAASNSMAGELSRVSGGRVNLIGVRKQPGSVETRINMLQRLLFEDRIFVSASCTHVIDMLKYIKFLPTSSKKQVRQIDRYNKWKHILDALTYMLSYESAMELSREAVPVESGLIMVNR